MERLTAIADPLGARQVRRREREHDLRQADRLHRAPLLASARTEQHWCPIRDEKRPRGRHERYAGFAPYGDGAAYRRTLPSLRAELKKKT